MSTEDRILRALAAGPCTGGFLRIVVGGSPATVDGALKRLRRAGRIERTPHGWKLSERDA